MSLSLDGQTAIVTGAAEGIGAAVAARLAGAGATVVVADLNESGAVATAARIGRGAFRLPADIADRGSVERLISTVRDLAAPTV